MEATTKVKTYTTTAREPSIYFPKVIVCIFRVRPSLLSSQFSNCVQNDVTAQCLDLASGQEKPRPILLLCIAVPYTRLYPFIRHSAQVYPNKQSKKLV